jgi:hypothetical protein
MPAGHGEFPPQDCIPDTVNGFKFVRDLYEKSNDTSGDKNPDQAAAASSLNIVGPFALFALPG